MATLIIGIAQFGAGLNGGETAFPHLMVKLFMEYAESKGMSAGGIFVDVSAAFASMLRKIIFNTEQGDELWLKQLLDSGFSHEDIQGIYSYVSLLHDGHDSPAPVPPLHKEFVGAQYTNSWFSTEFLAGVIATMRGTMAGMTMADLIYALAFARILYKLCISK